MGTHSVAVRSIPKTRPFIPSTACGMHIHEHFLLWGANLHPRVRRELKDSTNIQDLPVSLRGSGGSLILQLLRAALAEKPQEGTRSLPSLGIFPVIQHKSMKTQRSAQGPQPKADQCQKVSNPTHCWSFKKQARKEARIESVSWSPPCLFPS